MSSADGQSRRTQPLLVLFAEEDEAFARGYLAPALGALGDGQPAARLLGGAELRNRSVTALEAELAAHSSIVLVLTPAFFADPWARVGEQLASFGAVVGERRVIPLRLAPCELPLRLDATAGLELAPEEGESEEERWERWEAAMQRLRQLLTLAAPRPLALPCPYPGLRPYTASEAAFYFGRASQIDELVQELDAGTRELFLIGPSGSGKSSLLAAGLLPRMIARAAEQSRRLIVRQLRPGAHPTAALVAALAPDGKAKAGSTFEVEAALEALAGPQTHVLVVIDQLEEAFAQAAPGELRTFAAALHVLRQASASRTSGSLSVLYALRADFFSELLLSPLWAESSQRQHNLAPLSGAALRSALEQPALASGVYFESGLIELLLHDAAEEPGALPLLQETLLQLWQHRRQRLLSLAAYRALGQGGRSGLVTALAQHADRTLAQLPAARRALAKRLLLRLVAFGEGRPHTRRRQRRCDLVSSGEAGELGAVIDALARARLLILDSGAELADPDDDAVDLCHDALVTAWPQLAAWITERQADEERRRRLEAAAGEWVESGRGSAGLLDPKRYAAAAAWLESEGAKEIGCSVEAAALVEASRRALEHFQRRRQRRLVLTLIAVAFAAAVAIVLATLATLANRRAEANSARAEANERRALDEAEQRAREAQRANRLLGEQYLSEANDQLAEGRPHHAIPYLVAAREVGHDSASLRSAFWRATQVTTVAAFKGEVDRVALSGDSGLVLSHRVSSSLPDGTSARDGSVALWQPRTGAPAVALPLSGISWAQLSEDGTRAIVRAPRQQPPRGPFYRYSLWDVTARPPRELPLEHGGPSAVSATRHPQLSAHGGVLLGEVEGGLRLWDTRTGAALSSVFGGGTVVRARLDRDGTRVAAVLRGCVTVWAVPTMAQVAQRCQSSGDELLFPSDEPELVLLESSRKRLLWWNYATGTTEALEPARISVSSLGRNALAMGEALLEVAGVGAGRTVLAATDQALWRWDLASLERGPSQISHRCDPDSLRIDRVTDRAVMACGERGAALWHLRTGALLTMVTPPYRVEGVELSADGSTLTTLGATGQAHLWDLASARGPALLSLPPWSLPMASDDGRWLAATSQGLVHLYDVDRGAEATLELPDSAGVWLEFSPDGKHLLAMTRKRGLRVWDVAERRLLWHRQGGRREVPGQLVAWGTRGAMAVPLPLADDGRERVAVLEAATGKPLAEPVLFEDALHALRLSAEDRSLTVAGTGGLVQRWSLPEGKSQLLLDVRGDAKLAPWSHVNLAVDGSYLAATKDGEIRLWDLSKPGSAKVLGSGVGERVYFCAPAVCVLSAAKEDPRTSPDAKLSASLVGTPERLRVWSLPSGDERPVPSESLVVDVELHRGSRVLELLDARHARIRELPTGDVQSGELAAPEEIRHARFSQSGQRVLLWSSNGKTAVWQVGLDETSLEAWRRLGERNAVPPLSTVRVAPGLRRPTP